MDGLKDWYFSITAAQRAFVYLVSFALIFIFGIGLIPLCLFIYIELSKPKPGLLSCVSCSADTGFFSLTDKLCRACLETKGNIESRNLLRAFSNSPILTLMVLIGVAVQLYTLITSSDSGTPSAKLLLATSIFDVVVFVTAALFLRFGLGRRQFSVWFALLLSLPVLAAMVTTRAIAGENGPMSLISLAFISLPYSILRTPNLGLREDSSTTGSL